MRAGDVARDGQAQARPSGLQIAPFIQAVKGTKGLFPTRFGNTGAT